MRGEHYRRKYMYLYDNDDATRPRYLSEVDVYSSIPPSEVRFAPHQPIEEPNVSDDIIFSAWFAGGA